MRKISKRYEKSPPHPQSRCFPSSKKNWQIDAWERNNIKIIISCHLRPLAIVNKLARKFMFNIFTKNLLFRCTCQNAQPTLKHPLWCYIHISLTYLIVDLEVCNSLLIISIGRKIISNLCTSIGTINIQEIHFNLQEM